jgi:HlyD family secretion protein
MTGRKFLSFIGVILLITAVVYYFTTPSGKYIPLTGVIDGNEVVVSPQITGRIVNLTVDEGSVVKKGDLIAELDSKELEATLSAWNHRSMRPTTIIRGQTARRTHQ